VAEGCQSPFS